MSYYSRKHLELTLDQQRLKDAGHQQSRHDFVDHDDQDDQQWQDEYLAAELEGDAERNCTSNWEGW